MNILKWTLIYKFFNVLHCAYLYIKDMSYIKDTLYSENLKLVLKKYLKVNIKKDWIGRLYGVINPNIDINGNFDVNSVIIQFDDENTNNLDYVKTFIHKQLELVANLFKIGNLYQYISLEITHVGPQNLDNYLLVFDVLSRRKFALAFKYFFIQLIIYCIIALGIYFIFIK